ncbi:TPA: abortive phage resistance protein [Klebsiella pneumoniae]|uniref:AbiTii domain-containing protein n=1 Tax=Enterobacter cloacae TaxID=550 RepID=UPI002874C556|nr:abortive phage resistance protein [Enterobacter cloacae]MDR9930501.1 abortive phage resistance protein [Enterobacter cloacae subsp. dissolvens]
MKTSPVHELQGLASDVSNDIVGVLIKAKMIAVKLNLPELAEWFDYELDGYPDGVALPDYRIGQGVVRGWYPRHGWINVQYRNIEPAIITMIQEYGLSDSISALRNLREADDNLRLGMPAEKIKMLFPSNSAPSEVCWFINASKLECIVTTVRNKILTWALDLETKGILGEGVVFSAKEKEVAPSTTYNTNNFYGSVNNLGAIGAGNHGSIYQNNINLINSFESLSLVLKNYGLADENISDLARVISESPLPKNKNEVRECFGDWIGVMTAKALKGGLAIKGANVPNILMNDLYRYFNLQR